MILNKFSVGKRYLITDKPIGLQTLREILLDPPKLVLSNRVADILKGSRAALERLIANRERIYGVTTGFGRLSDTTIPRDKMQTLQRNLILSHATGIGPALPLPHARMLMFLRIISLAKGHSGVSLKMVQHLIDLWNHRIYPVIPEQGSVGASGDLVPLAHLGLAMMGIGEVFYNTHKVGAKVALRRAGLPAYTFKPKEALSLINGTQFMTAMLGMILIRMVDLLKAADVVGAMSLEALKGSLSPFRPEVQKARPHPGSAQTANNFRRMLKNSQILESHRDCPRLQDAYSLRCIPQVHGSVRDTFQHVLGVFEREINSSVDNPLILGGKIIPSGNFHGQPIAQATDSLCIALTTLGNISERRIERLTNPDLSGLPAFLTEESGLNSGTMMLQVTSSALASENRVLSYPASITSIPTGAAKEDHVSMGPISVRNCARILENVEYILAIEAMCAAQGLEFIKLAPGEGVLAAYKRLRRDVRPLKGDRYMKPDLEKVRQILPEILKEVQIRIGKLE